MSTTTGAPQMTCNYCHEHFPEGNVHFCPTMYRPEASLASGLPYQLGVTNPARRLERAAKAVADAAPDCRGVQAVGQVSVPVALMAAQQEALWGKKR